MEIGSLLPEKKILRDFTIYRLGGHLGHVTSIMLIFCFISMNLKAYIQNLVENGPVVSEKSKSQCSYVT